jgi:hypothetical protein
MRKRNKRTTVVSRVELSGVTEYILAGMGEEGKIMRARLIRFLEERAVFPPGRMGESQADTPPEMT